MDEKLKGIIDKVVQLCGQNSEFNIALRKRLGIASPAKSVDALSSVNDDIHAMREALEIRANYSISYDFISKMGQQRLRDQLLIDNLRMENAAIDLKVKEEERFYIFCVNAFYQIENIVNFYFHTTYPDINNLLDCIEKSTQVEGKYGFIRNRNEQYKTVGDISIVHKLNAVCNLLFPGDKIKITYSQLRQLRNEGEHRCMVIMEEHDEKEALYKFFKFNSFNSIRIILIKLVNAIKNELEHIDEIVYKKGTIINVLPSMAFIKVDGNSQQIQLNMLVNVKNQTPNSEIKIAYRNSKIIGIEDI